jgi:hypothetical protein
MNFNSPFWNSFWTYLTAGSPSLLIQLLVANGIFAALFLYQRARKSKADYPKARRSLQTLLGIANIVILFREPFLKTFAQAFQPLRGLFDLL